MIAECRTAGGSIQYQTHAHSLCRGMVLMASTSVSKTESLGSNPSAPAKCLLDRRLVWRDGRIGDFGRRRKARMKEGERRMFKKIVDPSREFLSDVRGGIQKGFVSYAGRKRSGLRRSLLCSAFIMSLYFSMIDSFLVWLVGKIL